MVPQLLQTSLCSGEVDRESAKLHFASGIMLGKDAILMGVGWGAEFKEERRQRREDKGRRVGSRYTDMWQLFCVHECMHVCVCVSVGVCGVCVYMCVGAGTRVYIESQEGHQESCCIDIQLTPFKSGSLIEPGTRPAASAFSRPSSLCLQGVEITNTMPSFLQGLRGCELKSSSLQVSYLQTHLSAYWLAAAHIQGTHTLACEVSLGECG